MKNVFLRRRSKDSVVLTINANLLLKNHYVLVFQGVKMPLLPFWPPNPVISSAVLPPFGYGGASEKLLVRKKD